MVLVLCGHVVGWRVGGDHVLVVGPGERRRRAVARVHVVLVHAQGVAGRGREEGGVVLGQHRRVRVGSPVVRGRPEGRRVGRVRRTQEVQVRTQLVRRRVSPGVRRRRGCRRCGERVQWAVQGVEGTWKKIIY